MLIQEYEVVEGEEGSNGEWEKELEDMLGEGPEPETEPEIIEPSSKVKNKNENKNDWTATIIITNDSSVMTHKMTHLMTHLISAITFYFCA